MESRKEVTGAQAGGSLEFQVAESLKSSGAGVTDGL